MKAEIVLTGTELLLGEIVDTNSVKIARMLREIGLDLHYKTTVGDNEGRIAEVLRHALTRVDFVIVSGGLGPTVDDVTRQGAARATDHKLVYHPELEAQIAARFQKFGRTMGENNKRQAWLPDGAIPIANPVGTAPSFIVETEQGSIICLPGVPKELEYLMEHAVIPYLKAKTGTRQLIKARILRTCGIGESNIDRQIDDLMRVSNPTVGLAAHLGVVDVRITAKAATEAEADALIAPVEAEIRTRLGHLIFGVDGETLAGVIGAQMQARRLKLAVVDAALDGSPMQALAMSGYANIIAAQKTYPATAVALADAGLTGEASAEETAIAVARSISGEAVVGMSILAFPAPNATETEANVAVVAITRGETARVRTFQYAYTGETAVTWLTAHTLNQLRRWLQELP